MASKKEEKRKIQFTKIVLSVVGLWAMLMVTATYILAAFGRETSETLSIRIVELIIASFVTYCLKAYFETKEEKKNELKEKELNIPG